MFDNHIGDLRPEPLVTQVPEVSNTADLGFAAPATFGLGLLIHPEGLPGGRRPNTGSWAGLFNTYYWVDRASDLYGIFGTQILPFYDTATISTLTRFEQAVYSG
jgi:CubicO group peptidase (beta-lactamase class C family)